MPRARGTPVDEFLVRALIGGVGAALVAGPFGVFVVWRRMAYFGATLAHAALLGVALGLILGLNGTVGVTIVCLLVAAALFALGERGPLASDTVLGILAHGTLAIGLVVVAMVESAGLNLFATLFGDILAIGSGDIAWIYGGGAAALGLLAWLWRPLLSATVHEELARVEGVRTGAVRLAFMLLIALVVAAAMKIVGVLLIVSLLIIPAATARRFAASPERMAALAALVGSVAVAGGLLVSLQWDTPAGPTIVAAATALFFLALAAPPYGLGRRA